MYLCCCVSYTCVCVCHCVCVCRLCFFMTCKIAVVGAAQVEKLTNFLDGGAEATKRRRFILGPIERIEEVDKYNLTR